MTREKRVRVCLHCMLSVMRTYSGSYSNGPFEQRNRGDHARVVG